MKNSSVKRRKTAQRMDEVEGYCFEGDPEDLVFKGFYAGINLYTKKALARELGVKKRKISSVISEAGLRHTKVVKFASGGRAELYRMIDVARLVITGGPSNGGTEGSGGSDEVRLLRSRADKAEIELEEMRGGLIRVNDVIHDVGDMLSSFRAKILGIPTRVVRALPPEARAEAEADVKKLVRDALSEIAEWKPTKRKVKTEEPANPEEQVGDS